MEFEVSELSYDVERNRTRARITCATFDAFLEVSGPVEPAGARDRFSATCEYWQAHIERFGNMGPEVCIAGNPSMGPLCGDSDCVCYTGPGPNDRSLPVCN